MGTATSRPLALFPHQDLFPAFNGKCHASQPLGSNVTNMPNTLVAIVCNQTAGMTPRCRNARDRDRSGDSRVRGGFGPS